MSLLSGNETNALKLNRLIEQVDCKLLLWGTLQKMSQEQKVANDCIEQTFSQNR